MPVGFLTQEQRARYGNFIDDPTPAQLTQYFYFDDCDRSLIDLRRGNHNRLGFAVQLGTVSLGTFLDKPHDAPINAQIYVAKQLNFNSTCLDSYNQRQTWWDHTVVIRQHYGYSDFSNQPGHWRLIRWLYNRAWWSEESPSVLFDQVTAYLVEHKILLPGATFLERLVAQVRERIQQKVWNRIAQLPSTTQQNQLEALLNLAPNSHQTILEDLRRSPTRYSAPALVQALQRLVQIRQFGVGQLDFGRLPPSRIRALARSAFTVKAQAISRMSKERRISVLVAFVYTLEATAQDDALDVLELLVKELLAKSQRDGKQARLRSLKDLDAAALQLSQACRVLLDDRCEPNQVRKTVFQHINAQTLTDAIKKVESLARPPDDQYYPEVLARWNHVRLFLPLLLKTIEFEANRAGQSLLEALRFLHSVEGKQRPKIQDAPLDIVTKGWSRWVVLENGAIDQRAYTFCVLEQLSIALGQRDAFVSPSVRWSNPRAKLLAGETWETVRPSVCRNLSLQPTPEPEIAQLKHQLDTAYQRTAQNWEANGAVRLELQQGKKAIVLSQLDKLEESITLGKLRHQVAALLPRVDLPEVLLEIQARTKFMDEFTHTRRQSSHH